jgi:hypothetical protein
MSSSRKIVEAKVDAEISDLIYALSRIKIRACGMLNTQDAVEKVLADPHIRDKLLAHMALHDSECYDFYLRFKANPEKALAYLNAEIEELESS